MLNNLFKILVKTVLPFFPEGIKKKWLEDLQSRKKTDNPISQYADVLLQKTIPDKPEALPIPAINEMPPETNKDIVKRRAANLIMVTADNNNKFYKMAEKDDGTFSATYGRVGSIGVTEIYPMSKWDSKYQEKIRKGYQDKSGLFVDSDQVQTNLEGIPDTRIRALIKSLQEFARKSISYNYNVNSEQVTPAQVNEAQLQLDKLVALVKNKMDIPQFNQELLHLFSIIPRKMKNVRDYLVSETGAEADMDKIQHMLAQEQATLDVMRSQVELQQQQKGQVKAEKLNLLDILGLRISTVEDKEVIKLLKMMMQEEAHRFVEAYSVQNLRTQKSFENHLSNQKNQQTTLFWHGSRNENWMSILETGMVLRPANAIITGKMFGYGLYFADRFKKSMGYTSVNGSFWAGGGSKAAYLAVFQVHTGEVLEIKKHADWCTRLDEKALRQKGNYDSVFARKGADLVNNEYIVYKETQCTIRYLIEIKS